MLDLETLGTRPGCAILSVGAVRFGDGAIHAKFYERVALSSCVSAGMHMDAETVLWWLRQGDAARGEFFVPAQDSIGLVLARFTEWLGGAPFGGEIWGNGAAFDPPLLEAAYEALHTPVPWSPFRVRCYRTMKALRPDVSVERDGTYHNALDDAECQARHLMRIEDALKGATP